MAPRTIICPSCHTENPAHARFCLNCGNALADDESRAPGAGPLTKYIPQELLNKLKAAGEGHAMQGERRVVTMLFCDVKGSTAMAEQLDPEEWAEIMNGTFEYLIRPIYQYEGTLARLMGDAILAFFGAPIAHEDDPQRAVLAGLAIISGIEAYRAQVFEQWGLNFDVRVGINTGLVVVGEMGSDLRVEYTAMGDAVNLAARMEQTAQAGSVQITKDTHRLIAPFFECEPQEGIVVKGKTEPLTTYRVLRRTSQPGQIRGLTGISTSIIGRERELATLKQVMDDLQSGHGHIVMLVGEAGLGKTRLMAEMKAGWGGPWHETTCVSYQATHPYAAFQQHLRAICSIAAEDTIDAVQAKLMAHIGLPEESPRAQALAIVKAVLEPENSSDNVPEGEAFQRKLYEIALVLQRTLGLSHANVVFLDDVHWMDSASVNLMMHLLQAVKDTPTCFVCTMRPDTTAAGWRIVEHARHEFGEFTTEIKLEPLGSEDSDALITGLLGTLPSKFVTHVLKKAEGNPFFVEEVIRALIDSQTVIRENGGWRVTADAANVSIPASLVSLLTARIDRLKEESRHTLQVAAVIGRRFSASILGEVIDKDFPPDGALADLTSRELISPVSDAAEIEYIFRHGLIHEATYNSILKKRRKELHQRIGELLEGRFPDRDLDLLGFHFLEAKDYPRAQRYYTGAGDSASRLYANAEAAQHYRRAIEAARKNSVEPHELTPLFLRCASMEALAGDYDGALRTYAEMRALAENEADQPMLLAALMAEATIRSTPSPAYDASRGEQLSQLGLELATVLGDRKAEAKILWNLMLLSTFSDDPGQIVDYGERALSVAREMGLTEQTAFILNDLNRAYRAVGDLVRSRMVLDESREMWRKGENLAMLTDNLGSSSYLCFMMGDLDAAFTFAEEGYQVSLKTENLWGHAYNRSGMAYVQFERGDIQDALDGMTESVRVAEQFMMALAETATRADLAWMLSTLGQTEQGRALMEQAIARLNDSQLPPVIVAWAWSAIARVRLIMGDLTGADEALALIPAGAGSDGPGTFAPVFAAEARADLWLARQNPQAAHDVSDAIERKLRTWQAEGALPQILWQKGRILNALDKPDEAMAALDEAQSLARKQSARRVLLNILIEKSHTENRRGNPGEASRHRKEADRIVEFITANIRDQQIRDGFLQRYS